MDGRGSITYCTNGLTKMPKDTKLMPNNHSAMWMCPVCNHVMTEEQSKGYRGCPPYAEMHLAQHVPVKLVPCPDCYGGHFRPCQTCGDSGMATIRLPNGESRDRTPNA